MPKTPGIYEKHKSIRGYEVEMYRVDEEAVEKSILGTVPSPGVQVLRCLGERTTWPACRWWAKDRMAERIKLPLQRVVQVVQVARSKT